MEVLNVPPAWKIVGRSLLYKRLRNAFVGCCGTVARLFFMPQYRAALFPRRVPVSRVDHPLDGLIPFNHRWVTVYLDFVAFWIRIAGFFLSRYGRKGINPAVEFIESIEELYLFADKLYKKNLSTTSRPRWLRGFRFILIHMTDPHLMCIPSLHVMIVIRGYTKFRRMLSSREPGRFQNSGEIELVKRQALDIVQAVLYVKQHSINCISAAMYAMSRLDPALFPAEEAELFVSGLFSRRDGLPGGEFVQPENVPKIKSHILTLYRRFIEEGKNAGDWCEPLLRFLSRLPRAGERGH